MKRLKKQHTLVTNQLLIQYNTSVNILQTLNT